MMRAWDNYLKVLDKELGTQTVNRWLRRLKILNFDAANIYFEAFDTFQAQWIEEHILPKAVKDFCNENNRPIKIHLKVANKSPTSKKEGSSQEIDKFAIFIKDPLDSEHTFESLVKLDLNKITYKLFEELWSDDEFKEPHYNPIFLYGPTGIGKTHLLQASASALLKKGLKAKYVKLSTFTQNMVAAIKTHQMAEFRQFYRDCDALMIDDIHNLHGKATTQEELFHTFNALHLENKQIIISSKYAPGELKNIEPRLISRFEWGIVMPFSGPNSAQLKKILEKKCESVNFQLSENAKNFLIEKFSKSPKTLSRALSALILRAHLRIPQGQINQAINLEPKLIQELLSDLIKQEEKKEVTVDTILDQIALYFGVPKEEVLGKSQSRDYVMPRQIGMFLCRTHLKLPFMKIGRIFSRDHSTVMSSVKQIEKNSKQSDSNASKALSALSKNLFPSVT